MLKLKLQYSGHLMGRVDSLELGHECMLSLLPPACEEMDNRFKSKVVRDSWGIC